METAVSDECLARFYEAVVLGRANDCGKLLTSARCWDEGKYLRPLSPSQRLRRLDRITFKQLRTTSLHLAAHYRQPDIVELLLRHGADVTIMDGYGRGPAVSLLEKFPGVIIPPSMRRPENQLLWNILASKDTLLDFFADVGGRLKRYKPIGKRRRRCLKLMLAHGLQVNNVAERRRGSTLLHIAARNNLVDVVELIVDFGHKKQESSNEVEGLCDSGPSTSSGEGAFSMLGRLRRSVGRQAQQVQGDGQHHCPFFRLGLRLGCKNRLSKQPGVRHCGDSDGRSSAASPDLPTSAATLDKVTTMGKTTITSTGCNNQPTSPERADYVKKDSVYKPVSQKCQPKKRGMTAAGEENDLQHKQDASASYRRYRPTAVDLEVRDRTGKTPLLVAVDSGSLDVALCLIRHGADLRTSDQYGRSIVHQMIEWDANFDLLLREIERQGISLNSTDHKGNTPLHVAAYEGQCRKVRFLIAAGACPDRLNVTGRSPLFLILHHSVATRETILLFLLASRAVCVRDWQCRLPALLQLNENARSLQRADALHKECDTLFRRCLLVVRRAVGLQRLLYMGQWALLDLPCPSAVLRAVYGEEERAIVDDLCL